MKKGLKITAITLGVLLLLMLILPFAFRGKIESIVKTEGNKMLSGCAVLVNLKKTLSYKRVK